MTIDEARRVLELPSRYSQRDVETAYARLYRRHLQRIHYGTNPRERDVASAATSLLQEAYQKLTGKPLPTCIKPSTGAAAHPAPVIPRASLRGRLTSSHTSAATSPRPATAGSSASKAARRSRPSRPPRSAGGWKERFIGVVIFSVICLIALLILGRGVGFAR